MSLPSEAKLKLIRCIFKYGLLTGVLTSIWIGFEYFTGKFFDTPQLGPFYGLVSILIFILIIQKLMKTTRKIHPAQSYWDKVGYGVSMITIASMVVVLFLLFYYSAMHPADYHTYEIEVFDIHLRHVLLTSIVGAWVGTLAEGIIISLVTSFFIKTK